MVADSAVAAAAGAPTAAPPVTGDVFAASGAAAAAAAVAVAAAGFLAPRGRGAARDGRGDCETYLPSGPGMDGIRHTKEQRRGIK